MFFKPSLGMFGNIERALRENQYRKNDVFNEVNDRQTADTENREAVYTMQFI